MSQRQFGVVKFSALVLLTSVAVSRAADAPLLGISPARNMVSPETHLPTTVEPGRRIEATGGIDRGTTKNVRWVVRLGDQTHGVPTVGGGRVYVGTNNRNPRDPKNTGDCGILLCLDERTGRLLWQLAVPKLAAGNNVDFEEVGLCSAPTIDLSPDGADRLYLVTNRCEVLCLDARGQVRPEAQAKPGEAIRNPVVLWRYDLRDELGVYPHLMTTSSVLLVGQRLYVTTSNGTDWTYKHVPSPDAPTLICLDKNTGKLLGQERSGISRHTFQGNWSSAAYGPVGGRPTVVFGGGDGFCYGFDPDPSPTGTLTELWRFDCNPPEYRVRNGKAIRYGTNKSPCEVLGAPVIYGDRVYAAIGSGPEGGSGGGCLNCISVTYNGDVATASAVWWNTDVDRSMASVSVSGDLLFFADMQGVVHCLDPRTGVAFWTHDTESWIWGSTLLADGKVYVGTEAGELIVLAAQKQKKVLAKVDFDASILLPPTAANGALFVVAEGNLYALEEK
jgi:outer membrane protein assembly factor BamB